MRHSSISLVQELYYKAKDTKILPKKLSLDGYCPESLQKSLKLRVVDAGDDESTMAELTSLQGPAYSLESYGIDFVASPKHADGIVIVGAITQNMLDPLLRAYNVIPEPKIVIALGNKAIHGDPRFS